MKKYNFIRVITFISVLLLFFAQSVYDPSVHAKMQKIEDESLSEISGESLYTGFNWTVRAVANGGLSIGDGTTSPDSINIGYLEIGNGTAGGNFGINTTMRWDVGSSGGQVWHLGGGFVFPSAATTEGMGLIANNIFVRINNGTAVYLGTNVILKGFYFGQAVTSATPDFMPFAGSSYDSPWILISNHGGDNAGFKFYGEVGAYINSLTYSWNGTRSVAASGVYVYGLMNETISNPTSPGSWSNRNGMTKIGGDFPTYNTSGAVSGSTSRYATVDVGTNSAGKTALSLNLPMAGSIRISNVSFGALNWGPIALDDIIFYTNRVNIRDL